MAGSRVHVLIGPGPLGLGLIAPVTLACGYDVHLIGRPGGGGVPQFERTLLGGDDEAPQVMHAAGFHCPPPSVVPYELRAAVNGADVVLITTTLRSAIAERIEFVHAVVDACRTDAEVVFAACENTVTVDHERLIDELRARGVRCLATVVDRVCVPRERFAPDTPRRVVCHQHGAWLLETPTNAARFVATMAPAAEVSFTSSRDVLAERRRKRLLMNGTHFAVGLLGHAANVVSLRDAATEPAVLDVAIELLGEYCELLDADFDPADTRRRALRALRIVCSFEDDVARVMSGFRRDGLVGFLAQFEELVAGPARRRARGPEGPPAFQRLAHALVTVIVRGDGYADMDELERGLVVLDEAGDRDAVAAFKAACTGWMPRAWVDAQATQVKRALRSQRARWSPGSR